MLHYIGFSPQSHVPQQVLQMLKECLWEQTFCGHPALCRVLHCHISPYRQSNHPQLAHHTRLGHRPSVGTLHPEYYTATYHYMGSQTIHSRHSIQDLFKEHQHSRLKAHLQSMRPGQSPQLRGVGGC